MQIEGASSPIHTFIVSGLKWASHNSAISGKLDFLEDEECDRMQSLERSIGHVSGTGRIDSNIGLDG
jgi:hypothetical protein